MRKWFLIILIIFFLIAWTLNKRKIMDIEAKKGKQSQNPLDVYSKEVILLANKRIGGVLDPTWKPLPNKPVKHTFFNKTNINEIYQKALIITNDKEISFMIAYIVSIEQPKQFPNYNLFGLNLWGKDGTGGWGKNIAQFFSYQFIMKDSNKENPYIWFAGFDSLEDAIKAVSIIIKSRLIGRTQTKMILTYTTKWMSGISYTYKKLNNKEIETYEDLLKAKELFGKNNFKEEYEITSEIIKNWKNYNSIFFNLVNKLNLSLVKKDNDYVLV